MNKNKKIFIITITFLMLVGLTTIAATDINDTTTITETSQTNTIDTPTETKTINKDTTTTKEASMNKTDSIQETTNTQETLNNKNGEKTQNLKAGSNTVRVSTFDELKNAFNGDYDEITINISSNIKFSENIYASNRYVKKIVIEGNNFQFDGQNKSIEIYGTKTPSVTINSLKFNNFSVALVLKGNVSINNSIFTNNTKGISISNGNLIVNNSQFINNRDNRDQPTGWTGGGGIDSVGTNIEVFNSYFKNNYASEGGAICLNLMRGGPQNGNLTIVNSIFENNTARLTGGHIEWSNWDGDTNYTPSKNDSFVKIYDSTFINGDTSIYKIYGDVKNCKFINDNFDSNDHLLEVSNSNFTKSYLGTRGPSNITNCNFINDSRVSVASDTIVYYWNNAYGINNITDCNFINNYCPLGAWGNTTITNCNFTNNRGYTIRSSGWMNKNGTLIITKSNFIDNVMVTNTSWQLNETKDFVIDISEIHNVEIYDNYFSNNTNNLRDMLLSKAHKNATLDIHDNIYKNNYLNDTIVTPQTSIIRDNQNRVLTYEIPINLREIYNDTVRNGTLRVYINGEFSKTYTVKDGKTNISILNKDLTLRTNEILLNYTGLNSNNKHYQNNTAKFNITKIVNSSLSVEAPDQLYSEDVALINITLVDVNGTPISGEIIDVFVDGVEVSNLITNANGKVVYPFSVSGDKLSHITIAHHTGNNSMYASAPDVTKKIDVQKIEPELYITSNITAHHKSNITIQMVDHEGNPIANKNLTIKITKNGTTNSSTVKTNNMGYAVYNFTPVDNGTLWVNVTYPGDTRYHYYSESVEIDINSVITNLEIVATSTRINVTNSITVEVFAANNAKVNGTVELDIDGEKHNLNIINGIGIYNRYKSAVAGEKHITANFTSSSAGYGHSLGEAEFNVEKLPTTINITTVNRTAGNVIVKVTVKPENNINSIVDGGNIIIQSVKGNTRTTIYNNTLKNGELTYKTSVNESGWYEFATEYFGNNYFYGEENNTGSIEVLRVNTSTRTFDKTARVGDKIILNASVTDENGKPVNDGNVIFNIDETQVEEAKIENGIATTEYTLPVTYTKGNYIIKANYQGNNKYNTSSAESKLSIDLQETKMNVNIINDTKANTTIEVTLNSTTDDNKPISGAEIIITDKDGNKIGEGTTDQNGKAIITVDIPVGNNNITISYPGDDINNPKEVTKTLNVTPRESQTTATITNNTVGDVTIDVQVVDPVTGEPVTGPVNIIVNGKTVGTGNLDNEGKATIPADIDKKGNYTIVVEYEGNDDYNGSTNTLDNVYIKGTDVDVNIVVDNPVVGETEVIVTIVDPETGKPIPNAPIIITDKDGNKIGEGTTESDGTVTIPVDLPAGDNTITIAYPGDNNHEGQEKTITTRVKVPTNVTVNDVKGIVLDNVTFIANVLDNEGNKINGGTVVFKVGGKTLTYANGTSIKTPVENGIAKLSYKAESGWIVDSHPNLKVEATYSGTSLASSNRSDTKIVTIYKRNATVQVSAPDDYVNGTLHIDAIVHDQNGSLIKEGNLVFKLNGLSLKDENNKGIVAQVTNGRVHLDVKLPFAYSAKKYNLTAIYSNKIYNKATGITTTTLKAIPTYINAIVSLSDQYSKPVITGQIYNKNNNAILQGTAVLNIKFDGISYAKKVVVNNGTFSETLEGISLYKPGTHKVEVTVGANSHYEGLRQTYTTKATAKYNATPIITSITRNKTTTRIQAKIVDDRNKNAQKDLKITIKVNGLSFLVNQTVRNGKVDVLVDTSTLKNRTYNLELVSGANTYYNAGKATTELPKY